ncbi:NAD(P)H-dependent oxidoreductase [Carboxylicivirga marina]|uniref:NAD(P)H-dependent oxidoreductase n=1 Tax=Carboxylicivirga marina TaxID=2800988 RepID=A0ABS1HMC7_9BACT|nr:NAD(P)H-dependent oxidoreductase [Carboxylicivirga marina]MBK3518834.1 NAD(P)H-dependent oxidoreductase [Carboxylicivirga marina]
MKKVLIIYAHPTEHKSRVNKHLVGALSDVRNVTVNNLYERYPDFYIDVKYEQGLLLKHDVIIWHHPFYWYSAPSLLKEWFDLVLEHGFAYGREGNALEGKIALNCITTGGSESTYETGGLNRFRVSDFLLPFDQSANLCKMKYLEPFVIHGVHLLSDKEIMEYTTKYRTLIDSLAK